VTTTTCGRSTSWVPLTRSVVGYRPDALGGPSPRELPLLWAWIGKNLPQVLAGGERVLQKIMVQKLYNPALNVVQYSYQQGNN
jgi:hypothetical protein